MSVNNGFITAPVSMYDVQTAISNSSTDLGTLCQYHSESGGVQLGINKWSRHKPVIHSEQGVLTDAQLEEVHFGFTVSSTTYTDPISAATATNAYVYSVPRGGTSAPYRLTDFNKYYHYAIAPCVGAGDFVIGFNTSHYDFGCAINMSGSDNLIGLSEINATLSNYYLAMIVRYTVGSSTYVRYATAPSKLGTGSTSISVDLTQGIFQNRQSIRNYEYWFAAANTKPSNPDGAGFAVVGGYFMPLPFNTYSEAAGGISFTVVGVRASISGYDNGNGKCSFWVTVYNDNSTGSVTVQEATIRMLSGNTYIWQDGFTRTYTEFFNQTVVPSGATVVVLGSSSHSGSADKYFSYTGRESAYYHNCKLELSITISNQVYTASVMASYDLE